MSDKEIDKFLKEIHKAKGYKLKTAIGFNGNVESYGSYKTLITITMKNLDLVQKEIGEKWGLTEKGFRISEKGGWLKHLAKKEQKSTRKNRKENWDYFYSKYRYFTYWWIFGFSVVAVGLSIYNFIQSLQPQKTVEYKEEPQTPIQQTEVEAAKPHNSSSTLQISDSLQSPNHQNNPSQIELPKDSL